MKRGLATVLPAMVVLSLATSPADAAWFVRGDADSSGAVDITDALAVLGHLFEGKPVPCSRAADVNDDGRVNVTDAVVLLAHLFLGGPAPGAPFPDCGYDPTDDALGCERFPACGTRGLFLCIDRSGSVCTKVQFGRMKADARKEIGQLGEGDQFAVLFFSANLNRFPFTDEPADATAEVKAQADSYIVSISCGQGGCPLPALLKALDYAALSTADHKSITYVSDGFTGCPGSDQAAYQAKVLTEVAAKNTAGVRIDTVGIGYLPNINEDWLQELAAQNGGSYTLISLE